MSNKKIKNLIIVESPAKKKTIEKYLNNNKELVKKYGLFVVIASFGHIRELDKKNDGHIKNGIDIKNGFKGKYIIKTENNFKTRFDNLKNHIRKAENIWLASDLDREGAAIAWHIKDEFKLKNYKRIIFNEITSEALSNAILNPTKINMNMVDSQQARRFIDRIVGFDITGLLWKEYNTNMKLSTGRVQSACLNIIINKEKSIKSHKSELYYSLIGNFVIEDYDIEDAKYCIDKKINKFTSREKMLTFLKNLDKMFKLESVDYKIKKESPSLPFITSTLQQTASSQLKMSIKQVMSLAQELYEGGFITYMRTDCYNLSSDFQTKCLKFIKEEYGDKYVGSYKSNKKSKGAQEAHEAIRVTKLNVNYNNIKGNKLTDKHKRLYDLIWKRSVGTLMSPAEYYNIDISIKDSKFKKNESFIGNFKSYLFDGYLKLYGLKIDKKFNIDEYINKIKKNYKLLDYVNLIAHHTWSTPPARYSEATIVKELEKNCIGRPSTYSGILSKLEEKNYYEKKDIDGELKQYEHFHMLNNKYKNNKLKSKFNKLKSNSVKSYTKDLYSYQEERTITSEKSRLVPTDIGIEINNYMLKNFPLIVDVNFTSTIENELDLIANGDKEFLNVMNKFYKKFEKIINEAKSKQTKNKKKLETYEKSFNINNKEVILRIAKYGPVIQYELNNKKNYISLIAFLKNTNKTIEEVNINDVKLLMSLPLKIGKKDNKDVELLYGRYGFYLKNNNKTASIFKQYNQFVINYQFTEIMKLIKEDKIKFK